MLPRTAMDMDMGTDQPTAQTTVEHMLEVLAGSMASTQATTVEEMAAGFTAIHGDPETVATGTVADVGLATNAATAHAAMAIVEGDITKIVVLSTPPLGGRSYLPPQPNPSCRTLGPFRASWLDGARRRVARFSTARFLHVKTHIPCPSPARRIPGRGQHARFRIRRKDDWEDDCGELPMSGWEGPRVDGR